MADPKTYTQEEFDAAIAEREAATAGLKANRDELLKESKAAKAKLAAYDGVDPEEFKKLKQAADEAEQKRAAAQGDFESLKRQLVEKHGTELSAKDAAIAKRQAALEKRLVQAELTAAIARHKGDPDLLLPHGSRYVKVKETEQDFEAFIADESGNPRYADGKGTPMSFDDLVTQVLLPKYPRAFEGTGSSGGGAAKSTGGAGGARVIPRDDNAAFLANVDGIADGTTQVR